MRVRGAMLGGVLLVSFCGSLMAASAKLNADDAVRTLGVDEYVMGRSVVGVTSVDLLSRNAKIGTVATMMASDGIRVISIERTDSAEHLQVYWDGRRVKFETGDGVLHSIDMDLETGELLGNPVALEIWQKHSASVQLAVAVTADVLSRTSKLHPKSEMVSDGPPMGPDLFEPTWWLWWDSIYGGDGLPWLSWQAPQLACNGPTVRGSVAGIGLTKSAICAAAREDANTKCWNTYCIGCCQLEPCDAFCYSGTDYLCATAGVTGTSCSLRR